MTQEEIQITLKVPVKSFRKAYVLLDEDAASEESLNLWVSSVKNKILIDSILETLAEAVRNIPNDQELGAYIREAYNRTDGKFI